MSCDVYVLPSAGCDRVWVYPNAPHPPSGGRPGGVNVRRETRPVRRVRREDEEALAVALLLSLD